MFYAEKAGHTAKWCGDRSNNTCWKITLRDDAGMATTLSGGIVVTDGAGGKAFISDKVPKGKKIRYLRLQEDKSVFLYPEDKQGAVWEVARDTATFHPDTETGGAGHKGDTEQLGSGRHYPGPVRRFWLHADRRRNDRETGQAGRVKPNLL